MSFVDLMGVTTFTENQIIKRTEAMVRSKYSWNDEAILNRKLTGVLMGDYTLSADEQDELADYQNTVNAAKAEADAARVDNALLIDTLNYEKAVRRLAQVELSVGRPEQLAVEATYDEFGNVLTEAVPYVAPIEPVPVTIEQEGVNGTVTMVPNPIVVKDEAERSAAQEVIANVTQAALDLYELRNAG